MKPIAVILAGGKSVRMGCDKADILWQGQYLWQYQAQKLEQSGLFSDVWVMRNKEGFLQDEPLYKHQGPLAGVYTALKKAEKQGDSLLFLPVDMPFISQEMLQNLLRNQSENQSENSPHHSLNNSLAQAVFFEGEIFPLLLHISCLPILAQYLQNSRSVYGFLEQLKTYSIPKTEKNDFTNMNKPCDVPNPLKRFS